MILFMFSMSDEDNPDPHNTSGDLCQFGDGFVWGGAAIVHLLGQRKAFELLDISSYLLAILHQVFVWGWCTFVNACSNMHAHAHICAHTCAHAHTCTHKHMHTHMLTHIVCFLQEHWHYPELPHQVRDQL